jgi:hypothetical protein
MQGKNQMAPIPTISNLNGRLSSTDAARQDPGGRRPALGSSAQRGSASSVRIVSAPRPYQGGFRLNV